ncbi:endonuclease/exonuclease/phosphatase family protein [Aestuariivivens sediminicola]|uniref:endonuclease/exonuclease/phosphatase family protein n=1 Tax=Aestuariivivens sediminicola TaxID=2913560 RepID=UPI001F59FE97|nr:endonuclease/exonuclease/phosphatase family protein [Aestuariivivens sediminicola]
MKKQLLTLILALFLSSPLLFAQTTSDLRIMSFNIRYDNPEDGKQNWNYRKENIIRMFHFYDLDIIGMQEVLVNQLNYLKTNLKDYDFVGVGREDGKEKGEYAPIFYRKDRFKALKSNTFWLSQTPKKVSKGWDADLERIATWVLLKDKITGKKFVVINTHFDHIGKQARIESAKLIKQKSISIARDMPVILTGDFNLTPESEGIQSLIDPKEKGAFVDSKKAAVFTYGPDWSTCGFDHRPFEKRKLIDYIFIRNVDSVKRYAVLAETLNELFLSDHCPIYAQISL